MRRMPYSDLAGFENVYLEDSYVMDVQIRASLVEFQLLVVLTERHPEFSTPPPDQQYCYRRSLLRFSDVQRVEAVLESTSASSDATGNLDYGNIDEFYLADDQYYLSGDWGRVVIKSTAPSLEIEAI